MTGFALGSEPRFGSLSRLRRRHPAIVLCKVCGSFRHSKKFQVRSISLWHVIPGSVQPIPCAGLFASVPSVSPERPVLFGCRLKFAVCGAVRAACRHAAVRFIGSSPRSWPGPLSPFRFRRWIVPDPFGSFPDRAGRLFDIVCPQALAGYPPLSLRPEFRSARSDLQLFPSCCPVVRFSGPFGGEPAGCGRYETGSRLHASSVSS